MPIRFTRLATPIGELVLTASDTALTGVYFPKRVPSVVKWVPIENDVLKRARDQLGEYFARLRTRFDLPLEPAGSPFERKVWDELRAIPFGVTLSYGELAKRIGAGKEARAVGAANGKNPIPIIVPCHRVIGANGDLTGFGGGIERKRWLLTHEGALLL